MGIPWHLKHKAILKTKVGLIYRVFPWLTWKSLNKPRLEVGRIEENLFRWRFIVHMTALRKCGIVPQTMVHLIMCTYHTFFEHLQERMVATGRISSLNLDLSHSNTKKKVESCE